MDRGKINPLFGHSLDEDDDSRNPYEMPTTSSSISEPKPHFETNVFVGSQQPDGKKNNMLRYLSSYLCACRDIQLIIISLL